MTTVRRYFSILCVSVLLISCRGDGDINEYKAVLIDGRKRIPWVEFIEKRFSVQNVDNFITHFGFDNSPKEWHTVVYFNDRYRMQITQKVSIDYRDDKILELIGDLDFVINEVLEIDQKDLTASYGAQVKGGAAEWKKFVESGGDVSVLPMRIETHKPVSHFEAYRKSWGKDIVK